MCAFQRSQVGARKLFRKMFNIRLKRRSAGLSCNLLYLFIAIVIYSIVPLPQASAKPFTFNFPAGFSLSSLVSGSGLGGGGGGGAGSGSEVSTERKDGGGVKPYTGMRVDNDSLRMIYWHDQTVAIVELGPEKLLLNCELIEAYDHTDGKQLRHDLAYINRPLAISFQQMVRLMWQCQQIEDVSSRVSGVAGPGARPAIPALATADIARSSAPPANGFSLLSGIIPGTKWCGTGDIAATYHDLGADARMDRCCRSHDLCPVKVRAFSARYNLTNNSIYSKSHCMCDDMLFACLKATNTSAAQIMGNIYFNLVQVPCLEDLPSGGRKFRQAKQGF